MSKDFDFGELKVSNIEIVKTGLILNDKYFFEGNLASFIKASRSESRPVLSIPKSKVKAVASDIHPISSSSTGNE